MPTMPASGAVSGTTVARSISSSQELGRGRSGLGGRFGQQGQPLAVGLSDLDRRKLLFEVELIMVLHSHSDAACRRHDAINSQERERDVGCV